MLIWAYFPTDFIFSQLFKLFVRETFNENNCWFHQRNVNVVKSFKI